MEVPSAWPRGAGGKWSNGPPKAVPESGKKGGGEKSYCAACGWWETKSAKKGPYCRGCGAKAGGGSAAGAGQASGKQGNGKRSELEQEKLEKLRELTKGLGWDLDIEAIVVKTPVPLTDQGRLSAYRQAMAKTQKLKAAQAENMQQQKKLEAKLRELEEQGTLLATQVAEAEKAEKDAEEELPKTKAASRLDDGEVSDLEEEEDFPMDEEALSLEAIAAKEEQLKRMQEESLNMQARAGAQLARLEEVRKAKRQKAERPTPYARGGVAGQMVDNLTPDRAVLDAIKGVPLQQLELAIKQLKEQSTRETAAVQAGATHG